MRGVDTEQTPHPTCSLLLVPVPFPQGGTGMPNGRVKFFNTDRGYGFIAPDGGGSDVFVHVHDVEATGMKILVAGQSVEYELGPARDGRIKAVKLQVLARSKCLTAFASSWRTLAQQANSPPACGRRATQGCL